MNPEREFLLSVFCCYLDHHPHEVKEQALDMCARYLEQHEEATRLSEHIKLLEDEVAELAIDYQILRIELEEEQKKNLSNSSSTSGSIELPHFLTSTFCRY